MKVLCTLFSLLTCGLSAITVHLNNDTIYPLEATVLDARGNVMVVITLPSEALMDWSDTFGEQGYSGPFPPPPQQNTYTEAPFKVVWRCPSGEVYSTMGNVFPGTMVQASQGTGNLSCKKSSSGTASSGAPSS